MTEREERLISDAVEESIEEVEAHSPGAAEAQREVVMDMAAARFNEKCDELGYEPDFDSASVLEIKVAVAVDRHLNGGRRSPQQA